jgi:hypothetical protein
VTLVVMSVAWLESLLAGKMESRLVGKWDVDWVVQMERQTVE